MTSRLFRILSISVALLFIQACSHPIEIVGQGDVTSTSTRGCTYEDSIAVPVPEKCAKNLVIGAYQETYYATPRSGWQFDHWGNYCSTATPPNYDCSFNNTAATVKKFWGQTVPPLQAVFVTQCGDGLKAGPEECDDGNTVGGDLCSATCTTELDTDGDGVSDVADNCPAVANTDQANFDNDTEGDACDTDDDNDGILDADDVCPLGPNTGIIGSSCTVTANGRTWAQPKLFTSTSWNQINAVCSGGPCVAGSTINGHVMTGWRWASYFDMYDLFNYFGVTPQLTVSAPVIYGVDSVWAPSVFTAGFKATELSGSTRLIEGILHNQFYDNGYVPYKAVMSDTETTDVAYVRYPLGNIYFTYNYSAGIGAWFYRE